MKKILAYLSPEKHPSFFDIIVAYDSGADVVVPYTQIGIDELRDLIYSATYTRSPKSLQNTAVFIGGHNVEKTQELIGDVTKIFNELPSERRVSVAMDPDGAYTTSCACVAKIKDALKGDISGRDAIVLAGTGPVGQMISALLCREGCGVSITSRNTEKAVETAEMLEREYGVIVTPLESQGPDDSKSHVVESEIIVSAGCEGVRLLNRDGWMSSKASVLADVNAIPPLGIEGIDVNDDAKALDGGRIGIGALAIGDLKMRCHHELVSRLFKEKGVFFDLEKVYNLINL